MCVFAPCVDAYGIRWRDGNVWSVGAVLTVMRGLARDVQRPPGPAAVPVCQLLPPRAVYGRSPYVYYMLLREPLRIPSRRISSYKARRPEVRPG